MITFLVLGALWISLALGIPAYIQRMKEDRRDIAPKWWALAVSAIVMWGVDSYYRDYAKHHSQEARAYQVLEKIIRTWDSGDRKGAMDELSNAAKTRSWESAERSEGIDPEQ